MAVAVEENDIELRNTGRRRLYYDISSVPAEPFKTLKKHVLKILILEVLFPLADVVTDIMQGVFLIIRDGGEKKTFGVLVLVICWLPGLICILHVCSHYRWTVCTVQ